MTRLKFLILILASIVALTSSSWACAQTAPPAGPTEPTSAQQAAASAKTAENAAKEAQQAANAAQATAKAKEAATAAADAGRAADAAKTTKDPQEALRYAHQAAAYAEKAAAAAEAAQDVARPTPAPVAGCPAREEVRSGIVDHWWRPQAGADYFKLEYDVSKHQMKWFDYKHQGNLNGIDVLNGSVLPVIYSREKVLIHVNCLHPTDTLSITTNDIALPEQGADIRGVTPPSSTATALTPTLDSLGTASAAGTALGTPGFSFGAPPTLPTGTTSLFTPGTSKDGTTYTDAVINIAPEALAIETNALVNQVMDAINSYNELETGKRSDFKTSSLPARGTGTMLLSACSLQNDEDLPGSICGLQVATKQLLTKLSSPTPADNTLSAFNDYLAQTQTLVSQLNGLAAGMNQASLPARAIAIRQNMEAIVSLLGEVSSTFAEDVNYGKNLLQWVDSKQTIKTAATCQQLYEKISAGDAIDAQGPPAAGQTRPTMVKSNPPDTPICHAMEQYTLGQFLQSYHDALDKIKGSTAEQLSNTSVPHSPAVQIAMAAIYLSELSPHSQNVPADLPLVTLRPVQSHSRSTLPLTGDNLEDISYPLRAGEVSLQESNSPDFGFTPSALRAVPNSPPDNSTAYPILTAPICPSPSTAASCTNPNWVVDTGPFQNSVEQLFQELIKMREQVGDLDQQVGRVFAQMNDRYLGSWVDETDALPPLTSNTIVRVGINVQRNYTPFTLTGGATVGTAAATQQAAPVNSGGGQQGGGQAGGQQSGGGKGAQSAGQGSSGPSASASPSGATSTTGSNDFTVVMEVHRFANFNLVGGVMAVHAKNYSFATVPEYASFTGTTGVATGTSSAPQYTYTVYVTCPPGANVTSTTSGAVPINGTSNSPTVTPSPSLYYCLNQTQTASLQPAGMVGIAWFPWHRDYFPRGRGALFQGRDMIPSFMAASAVTTLGSVFFGPNFEPFNGIDLFGGWGTANVTGLAKGTSLNQVLLPLGSSGAAPTINTATHVKGGYSFGIGFDISVFLQLFGKTQGPSLP